MTIISIKPSTWNGRTVYRLYYKSSEQPRWQRWNKKVEYDSYEQAREAALEQASGTNIWVNA